MRTKLIRLFRILFIFVFISLVVLFRPVKSETNLLRAVFPRENNVLVDLSNKFSSRINVLIETSSPELSENIAKEFVQCSKGFKVLSVDPKVVLRKYETFQDNLLSDRTYLLLQSQNYSQVSQNSLEALYNPVLPPLAALEDDPFLLFTDYIMSLSDGGQISGAIFYNDKYYNVLMLEVNKDLALSPTVLNKEVKKLVQLQDNFKSDDVKIYLTGTPIHSYYASSRSILEINIICILSTLFVIGLVYIFFSSFVPIIPIILSIGLGILAGFLTTVEIFRSIHILTFVFSTTLIGICVDYSLHYFVGGKKIFKSLTVGFLTTASAFLILLFSQFELLKQISVFTIAGLACVYSLVILFYPLVLKDNFTIRKLSFEFSDRAKHIILGFVVLVSLVGLVRIKFDDNIKNMYVPSKDLLQAEKLFAQVMKTNGETSFLVVKGDNFQDMLEKEELITDELALKGISFQALSKYIPSENRQQKNIALRKELYKKQLDNFATFLNPSQKQKLLNKKNPEKYLVYDKDFEFLNSFLVDENTSVIVLAKAYDGAISLQKDISSQIEKCRKICVDLILPIFIILYLILVKIYDCKSALKIILPSVLATTFVFGTLGIFHQELNLFHVLAIFLVIGFGLDYSVFRHGGEDASKEAVLLSCLTTVISFGLLGCAGFKLISSIGIVVSLGLVTSYILSLVCIKSR